MTQSRTPGTASAPSNFSDFYKQAWPGAVQLAALLTQDARASARTSPRKHSRASSRSGRRVENPNAYLRVAVVNACRSWQSRRVTERTKLPLVAAAGSTELAFDVLADAVAALPYRQRATLVLRYYEGLSEAESRTRSAAGPEP